ncbi:MAG: tyrosine-type recombinase/integrase [Terriglobales bacterium]
MTKDEKRRQRGTGSIFRKPPNKNWFIQFYRNGHRIREATGSADYDTAKKLLRQRLHEIDKNEYLARHGKAARVRDLYELLEMHNLTNKKGRKRDLPGRWKHLEPAFGTTLAAEVTTDDVLRYVRARQEKDKAENATINRELAALKRMFRLGFQSTPPKVPRVPHIPLLRENNVRRGFVEEADFERLAANASQLWLRTFLELAYTYGWRLGELVGLRVRQVNFEQRTIRLDPGTTKNREGRQVTMTARVYELLREACAAKTGDGFVLTRARGNPIKDFRADWQRLCAQAGLGKIFCCACGVNVAGKKCKACGSRQRKYSGLIPHDLRRSAAKAARRAGVPESVVMAMGGWKTSAVFRRYAIVSSADQQAAVDMLEAARARQRAEPEQLVPREAYPEDRRANAKPS